MYDSFVLSRDVQQEAHKSKVKGRHSKIRGHHANVKERHMKVNERHFEHTPDGYHAKHTPDNKVLTPFENADEL